MTSAPESYEANNVVRLTADLLPIPADLDIGAGVTSGGGAEPLLLRRVGFAMLGALWGEQNHGNQIKRQLEGKLLGTISAHDYYQSDCQEEDSDLLAKKLMRFRPRLVGAVAAYAHLSGSTYEEIVEQNGLESFYLFWALGYSG